MTDLDVAGAAPLAVPDVFTELELFTMEMADEVGTVDDIYYGGDYDGLWDPECDDIGYTGNFDGQSESSDYEYPRDFYRDEWLDWCDFNAPDGSYGFFPEDGEAQLPVSKCTPGTAVEETATGTIAAGFVGYICFCERQFGTREGLERFDWWCAMPVSV